MFFPDVANDPLPYGRRIRILNQSKLCNPKCHIFNIHYNSFINSPYAQWQKGFSLR